MELGAGPRRYEVVANWPRLPDGVQWGQVVQVVVDSRDRAILFHRATPGVLIFDTDGEYLGAWPEDGSFQDIHSAWLGNDSEGEFLLIVDRDRNTLARTTLEGEIVWSVTSDLFNRPTDAAMSAAGEIYVSDGYGNALVHRLSARGEHIQTWGGPGSGPGQFNLPHGVWLAERDGRERVYVCDRENRRVQTFTLDGEYIDEIPGLRRPTDIIVDAQGTRYVTELEHGFTMLDSNDNVIAQVGGTEGREPGSFVAPHAAALDSDGSLYIVEVLEGRRVQKFRRL